MRHHQETIRLSVDLPADLHLHLKLLTTKKEISMRDYILEALALKEASEEKEAITLDDTSFRKGLNRLRKERSELAKRLSKR